MKIADNRALVAEKKQYIIPNTTIVAFLAGFICQTTSPVGPNLSITGGIGIGVGGGQTIGNPD